MNVCIFEDGKYEEFFPLTMTRATFELKCGYTTLIEKILRRFPAEKVSYFLRDFLVPNFRRKVKAEAINNADIFRKNDSLFINGRWLIGREGKVTMDGDEEIGLCGQDIVYARLRQPTIEKCFSDDINGLLQNAREKVPVKEIKANLISYPWDLISNNPQAIKEDFEALGKRGIHGKFSPHAVIEGSEENLFVAETAEVEPNVVLDVTNGPIIIDEGAKISTFSRIRGPSGVGKNSRILRGNIHEGVSIGPVCGVGGEVEESIIHGYSNKYHTGFLGHAYVGEWVMLGAATTNSDLKDDYSTVQVYMKGTLMDTGQTKMGCIIGDHAKTSIGCMLNTGAVIGVMSTILASGELSPKFIPSFCWHFRGKFSKGPGFRSMLETARNMMGRRGITLSEEEAGLLQRLYEMTKEERETIIRRSRAKLKRKVGEHDVGGRAS